MCRKLAQYGLGIFLLALAGLVAGVLLTVYGFTSLWWSFPGEWEVMDGLNGRPQELLALQVPDGLFWLQMAEGGLFTCQKAGVCEPAEVDWRAASDARLCDGSTRPWITTLFPLALNWNSRVVLGCEVGYQSTGRNVFILHDRSGKTYATYGAIFLPTDFGMILVGLVGGAAGLLAGCVLGVVIALVLLAKEKKNHSSVPGAAG